VRKRIGLQVLSELPERPADGESAQIRRAELEAFRLLYAGVTGLGSPEVVLVSEAGRGGRGTDAAIGLATAAVLAGKRVLLMDCHLSAPRLHEALGIRPVPGIREYIGFEAEAPQLLQPVSLRASVAPSDNTGQLVCIAAGRQAANAGGLLASPALAWALQKIRHGYELVILRGPPLRASETPVVAGLADAFVLCAAEDEVKGQVGRIIRAAVDKLPQRPAGLVDTGVAPKRE
jgi:Mrp family chromosome partitioning ATPase